MDKTPSNAGHKEFIIDLHLYSIVQITFTGFSEHRVEAFCLWDGTWEPVKDKTTGKGVRVSRVEVVGVIVAQTHSYT